MLEDFIKTNKLSAKVFPLTKDVSTSYKAAAALGLGIDAIVKSILLMTSEQEPVLVILLGKDKIDFQKVKKIIGAKDVLLAEPEEVLEITGYEVGGVPPISIYGIRTLVDKGVAEKEEVVCGGGTPEKLMKIKVHEILEFGEDISIENVKK